MKRFFAILLVAVLLLSTIPATSMAAKYGTVVGGWLRLRSAPNFNAGTITSYYTGTVVEITGSTGGWYRVYTPDGRSGYMYGQYLQVGSSSSSSSSGNAYVTSHNGYAVRLRQGPGTGYRVIASYEVGTPVDVLERGSYWSRVSISGTKGYMMTQFLSFNGGYDDDDDDKVVCYATIWSRNGYGVRLRKGPGKDYGTIGTYSVGTTVAVLKKGDVWDKIRVGSRVGYMMNEFLDYHKNNEVTSVTLNTYSPAVGTVLSVKAISPSKATVSYEWRVNGVTKGTASTYTVTSDDIGYKIQLKVTGKGSYTGSAKSDKTNKVLSNTQISDVVLNTTAPVVGNTLKVTVTPATAKVIYAWIVGDTQVSNAETYTVKAADVNKIIKLIVTGTGDYSGGKTLTTAAVSSSGTLSSASIVNTTNTASGAVPAVGDVLSASVKPNQATVSYQWQRDGADISGATSQTYTLTSADAGKPISVKVTAVAPYIGSTTSDKTANVIEKPAKPSIITTELTDAIKGTPYSQNVVATGTSLVWSVTSGTLPTGLSLDGATGAISGTPIAHGTSTFTVTVTDPIKQNSSKELTLKVIDPNPATPKLEVENISISYTEGYTAEPVAITIKNTGDANAIITSVKTEDDNFVVTTGNTTISASQTDISWKITPPEGVSPRVASKTITVTYNDGREATATLTMTVKEKESNTEGEGGNSSDGGNAGDNEVTTAVKPAIQTGKTYEVKEGEAVSILLLAEGSGNLIWSATDLPDWMVINAEAGKIIGTAPEVEEDTTYHFDLNVASDDAALGENNSDSIEIAVTVKKNASDGEQGGETTQYSITVNNGTADKSACAKGEKVAIEAATIAKKVFKQWNVVSGGVTLEDANSSSTTFTMQEANVEVTAVYDDIPQYHVTVIGGSGSGDYEEKENVNVSLGEVPAQQEFDGWVIQGVNGLTASSDAAFSFQMPANSEGVTITAQYKPASRQLDPPENLRWEGRTAKWDAVEGAQSYMFYSHKISEGNTPEKSVGSDTSYTFTGTLQAGDTFFVKAVGNGDYLKDSQYVESSEYAGE